MTFVGKQHVRYPQATHNRQCCIRNTGGMAAHFPVDATGAAFYPGGMSGKHVLVAGASGLVGQAAMRHFANEPGTLVTAVSRRAPLDVAGVRFLAADLADERASAALLGGLAGVTHLVYAALHERPGLVDGWREAAQIETNARMLRNLFVPLARANPGLRHVTLLQGTKAYGAHVRRFQVPAREGRSEARDVPNFYWLQEEYLRAAQAGQGWSWTILRPQIVVGLGVGGAMNLIAALGADAALRREAGEPWGYPGGTGNILEAVDAGLLAEAIAWAGEAAAAANQVFNIANGDVFVWENIWPAIAEALGMEPDPAAPRSLAATSAGRAAEWDRIRERYGLAAPPLPAFVGESLHYADFCMGYGGRGGNAALVSTVKLRQAGFHAAMDTEAMFRHWFGVFQASRLLPRR